MPISPSTTLFRRALEAQDVGDIAGAQRLYEQTIRLSPSAVEAYNNLAALHNAGAMQSFELGDTTAAVRQQKRAVGVAAARGSDVGSDALASGYVRLGHYLMMRRHEISASKSNRRRRETLAVDAELALEHALTLSPDHQEARLTGLRREYHAALERRFEPQPKQLRPTLEETHSICKALLERGMEARQTSVFCGGEADWVVDIRRDWPGDDEAGDQLVRLADAVSLTGYGGSWLYDRALLLRARHTLVSGRPIVLKNALQRELAEATHQELMSADWRCDPDGGSKESEYGRRGSLWMRRCTSATPKGALAMQDAASFFRGEPIKRLIAELTGETIDGWVMSDWTWVPEAGFFSLHNDVTDDRRVSFAWHLAKDWEEEGGRGGELAFLCGPEGGSFVQPAFNQLTLFHVHRGGMLGHHAVLPVVNTGVARRFALFGWFTRKPLLTGPDPRGVEYEDDE